MRHERPTEELKEQAALYALGSLTQQEARSFEMHLKEGCAVCEAEFRRFDHAAVGIGLAAAEAAAPEYIRDLLSARIAREPQTAQPAPVQLRSVEEEKTMQEFFRPRPASPQLWSHSKPEKPSFFPWVLVIALAALGLFAANLWRTAEAKKAGLETQLFTAQTYFRELKDKLEFNRLKADNMEALMAIVGKPAMRAARLIEQSATPAFSGAVIWDTSEDRCLVLGNFPPAPEGKRYQLWFFTPAAKVSAGSLYSSTNEMFVSCPVPREAAGASAAVVTLEPDNGSQIPTSPYFAVGRIE